VTVRTVEDARYHRVIRDPVLIATEGASSGSVKDHGFLREGVIISNDAGPLDDIPC
jgi:hypothetical protein